MSMDVSLPRPREGGSRRRPVRPRSCTLFGLCAHKIARAALLLRGTAISGGCGPRESLGAPPPSSVTVIGDARLKERPGAARRNEFGVDTYKKVLRSVRLTGCQAIKLPQLSLLRGQPGGCRSERAAGEGRQLVAAAAVVVPAVVGVTARVARAQITPMVLLIAARAAGTGTRVSTCEDCVRRLR